MKARCSCGNNSIRSSSFPHLHVATSMCSLPVFVGLDYHDSSVRVCVLDSDGSELANVDRANNWKAIAKFADHPGRPVRAVMK